MEKSNGKVQRRSQAKTLMLLARHGLAVSALLFGVFLQDPKVVTDQTLLAVMFGYAMCAGVGAWVIVESLRSAHGFVLCFMVASSLVLGVGALCWWFGLKSPALAVGALCGIALIFVFLECVRRTELGSQRV